MAAPGTPRAGSCQSTGSRWIRAAQHLQEHERQELRAAGRRKLQELRAASTARPPVTMRVSDSSCSTDCSSLASPASITSSSATTSSSSGSSTAAVAAAAPAARGATSRTSVDSNATASCCGSTSGPCERQQGGSCHASPVAAPVAAAAGSCAEEAAGDPADTHAEAPATSQGAVATPPSAAGDDDPMVHMLLAQVGALMSERQQLACKCDGLERENVQLAELVGHLNVALEETQLDAEHQQQQQQQLGADGPAPPAAAALVLAHQQQQRVAEWLEQRAEQGSQESHDCAVAGAAARAHQHPGASAQQPGCFSSSNTR